MYKATATVKGPDYLINQGDKITDELYSKKLIDRHKAKFVKIDDKTHDVVDTEASKTAEKPQAAGVKK